MRVIVTRPRAQADAWVGRLLAAKIEAVALPLIDIAPVVDATPLRVAWHKLVRHRLVIFVSPNAVLRFFAARPAGMDWPAATFAGSTGPGTSRALLDAGLAPNRIAEPSADAASFDSEALWAVLRRSDWRGAEALVVRGEDGRDWLAQQLGAAGAHVTALAAYRRGFTELGPQDAATLRAAVADPDRHLWFFSSSAAIDRLVGLDAFDARGGGAAAAASALTTHPRIAATARRRGFGRVIEVRPTPEAVVACLQSLRL